MAEGALFSLASKVLSTIASPAFEKAYEGGQLICGAKEELERLRTTIESIQAVLLDAEKKQEDSLSVKNWVKRVRGVLYDADDLFDEIATADLLKKQMKGNKLLKKVHVFFSELNPIVSRYSIATRIKDIRKSLIQISEDMVQFRFVRCLKEEIVFGGGRRVETGSFIDPKEVIGRTVEKKAIKGFLFSESDAEQGIPSVAVVGIGGMGKTTLAQLVYNDEEVQRRFEKKWWACISDIVDDKEVIGKIFQSITGKSYQNMQMTQLESEIRQLVSESGSFLLVLDDVWDEDHARWMKRMSLLRSGAIGSRIIVTTRSSSVARAMDARVYRVNGLSEDESWKLFERLALSEEKKDDAMWISLGREIVKKCSNVPLAIKCIASTLYTKSTLEEWKSFKNDELSKIELSDNPTMSALRFSYDHLSSNLKQCFAYCSLYPKDCEIDKQKLIYLWIAQGYVRSGNEKQSVEEIGHAYFMELLRRSFFQEISAPRGSICKMHDLVHDLAQHVAEDEIACLSGHPNRLSKNIRQISIIDGVDASCEVPASLLSVSRLRSLLFMVHGELSTRCFDQQLTKFKILRALHLEGQNITEVPNSIGDLKHLRYLDLSRNGFKYLPESVAKLVNLLSLNISVCGKLEAWPSDFRKLLNLRNLDNRWCDGLRQMPAGFGELASLRNLSEFIVGRVDCNGGRNSGLGSLGGLMLRGTLNIEFKNVRNCWERDECWNVPATIETLYIRNYPGWRIPNWCGSTGSSFTPNIVKLVLLFCPRVKQLPPLRDLPYLGELELRYLDDLEYVEEKESATAESSSSSILLPCLKILRLYSIPRLKGWSRKVEANQADVEPSFPLLEDLEIRGCPELKSMPLCPRLRTLELWYVEAELISLVLSNCLHSLQSLKISDCDRLVTLSCEALTSLRHLEIYYCDKLRNVKLAPPSLNHLEVLKIGVCKELELWEEEKRGVDWDSLPSLRLLHVQGMPRPPAAMLPPWLEHLRDIGELSVHFGWIRRSVIQRRGFMQGVGPRGEGVVLPPRFGQGGKEKDEAHSQINVEVIK